MLEFGKSLAAGAASGSIGYALVLFGSGPLSTCGILASGALVFTRTPLRLAAWLLGLAAGLIVAALLVPDWGLDGIVTASIAAAVIASTLTAKDAATNSARESTDSRVAVLGPSFVPILGATMALAIAIGAELRAVTTICGLDSRSLVYGIVPALACAALGASVTRFLVKRHPTLRPWLVAITALGAATLLLASERIVGDRRELVEIIQTPAASRRAFLFGVSLAMTIGVGAIAFTLGVLAQCVATRAMRNELVLAAPIGTTAGALLVILAPVHPAIVAGLAITVGALGIVTVANRSRTAIVAIAAALLATVAWRVDPPSIPPFTLTDRHALYFGAEDADPPPTANGRPHFERDPPGWPFQSEVLPRTIELVRAAASQGEILLIGDEAAALAAGSADRELAVGSRSDALSGRPRAGIVFLPSIFASRLRHFPRFDEFVGRALEYLRPDGRFVVVADLAQIDLESLAAVVRAPRDHGLATRVAIHGRHAVVFADRSTPTAEHDAAFAALARPPRPTLLLGAEDTGVLATIGVWPHHPAHEYLLQGEGRARLPHSSPKQASANLRRLLRLTRSTRAAPEDIRIRLELAAAILDDDYATEDRLLRLLARAGAEDASRLLVQRTRARERIVEYLLADREDKVMALDADLRFRIGRVMRGLGNTLAAIEEFVRVVELRPHLLEAPVALAEVFLDADAKRLTRSVHGHIAYGRDMPFQLDVFIADLEDESLLSRMEVARGVSHLRTALELESPSREDFLRQALGRFRLAFELDPAAADATRLYGETLYRLGFVEEARQRARQAVSIAPLDPRTHALLATVTDDPKEALRAKAEVLRLAP